MNPKQNKPKEINAKIHHSQTSENERQRKKILKAVRDKQHLTCRGKTVKTIRPTGFRNHGGQRKWHIVFQVLKEKKKKKRTANPEFYN